MQKLNLLIAILSNTTQKLNCELRSVPANSLDQFQPLFI